jgi:hypothetical protein
VGSCSGGILGEDANPDGDRTNNRFLSLDCFFTLDVSVLRRFVDPDLLKFETNNVYRCKTDLEILISKFYDMIGYYNRPCEHL